MRRPLAGWLAGVLAAGPLAGTPPPHLTLLPAQLTFLHIARVRRLWNFVVILVWLFLALGPACVTTNRFIIVP